MSGRSALVVSVLVLLAASAASAQNPDINEVGAVLLYPIVSGLDNFVHVTNAGPLPVGVRLLYFDEFACSACTVEFLLQANGTETAALDADGGVTIKLQANGTETHCSGANGFVMVHAVDPVTGLTSYSNVLIGSANYTLYDQGWAGSIPAVSVQARGGGSDGSTRFEFDGNNFSTLPQKLRGQFIAPDVGFGSEVFLALFTTGFIDGTPPSTECSVTVHDPTGATLSQTTTFACAKFINLESLSPSFTYPDFVTPGSVLEHGWVEIECEVDGQPSGGVHGALMQYAIPGEVLRREDSGPAILDFINSLDLFYQSEEPGTPVTFAMEICNGLDDDEDNTIDEGCDDDGDGYCDGSLLFAGQPPICPNGGGDCNDQDALVFAVSPEIANVRWLDPTGFIWDSVQPVAGMGTSYDVVRGRIDELPVGGPNDTCVASNQFAPALTDATPPAAGGSWYLVRGTNSCGDGSYGQTSLGTERATPACP